MVWLYTETVEPLRDGPYISINAAMSSDLWEWLDVCVWVERKVAGGWVYENVKWNGRKWIVTSRGIRPAEPVRPELLFI